MCRVRASGPHPQPLPTRGRGATQEARWVTGFGPTHPTFPQPDPGRHMIAAEALGVLCVQTRRARRKARRTRRDLIRVPAFAGTSHAFSLLVSSIFSAYMLAHSNGGARQWPEMSSSTLSWWARSWPWWWAGGTGESILRKARREQDPAQVRQSGQHPTPQPLPRGEGERWSLLFRTGFRKSVRAARGMVRNARSRVSTL
jgi:hypothetical protein